MLSLLFFYTTAFAFCHAEREESGLYTQYNLREVSHL